MSGVGKLIKTVSEDLKGAIVSLLGGGSGARGRYPATIQSQPILKITNQPEYSSGAWRKSVGYEFRVVEVNKDGSIKGIAPGWRPFQLQINPQELTQDEVFAIQVTPTFRGVIVEHQGVTLKDITLQGTTGISPLRREGGAKKDTGAPVLASGHSGFEEFHELRSYFRAYVEAKRLDTTGNLRMVFSNFKDNEYIFVEPQKFTMKRSASRPFLYEYQIALKGIGVANGKAPSGGFIGMIADVFAVVDKALDYMQYGAQIISGSIGLIRRTERNIVDTILNPLRTLNAALLAIRGGEASLLGEFGITRRFVVQLKDEVEKLEANLSEVFGVDIDLYNSATGRISTLKSQGSRTPTYQEFRIMNALSSIKKGVFAILQNKALFVTDSDKEALSIEQIFQKRIFDGQNVVQVQGDLVIDRPNSVRAVLIDGKDTIHTIAARELGDPDKFREIVTLNNLRPPYISNTGGQGVLKPGDKILIPKQDSIISQSGVAENIDYNITKLLNQTEKGLGVDLRIDENNDLVFANFGDLDLVAGIDNMSQAILIRLGLEPGSLKRHPEIGVGLEVGGKVANLNEIRSKIISTLSQDSRIEAIPFISLQQESGTTTINMIVKIRELNEPVPLEIAV